MTASIGTIGRGLAASLLAIGLSAGCGGESEPDGGGQPSIGKESSAAASERVRDAADLTLALDSFAVESDVDLTIGDQSLEFGVEGAADYADVVADVTISTAQNGAGSTVHILADGTNAWVSGSGSQFPSFPGGASWLRGDAAALASADSFTQTGLIGVVLVLRGAEEVEDQGADQLDGTAVRRYSTSMTYDEAVAAAGAQAEAFKSSFSLTGQASGSTLHVDVALDDDGIVRELTIDVDSTFPVDGTYRLALNAPGGDVPVPDAPPADDIASGPEADALFRQMLR